MNDDKATVIAKEILNYIYYNSLKLEFSVVHASIQDGIRDILVNRTAR